METAIEGIIYEMLTTRKEIALSKASGQSLEDILRKYEPQRVWYRSVRDSLQNFVSPTSLYSWESNPGWF